MKHLLLIILTLSFVHSVAQDEIIDSKVSQTVKTYSYEEVYKWEGFTRTGIYVFGIARSRKEANEKMNAFITKYWKTSYRLIYTAVEKELARELGYFDSFYTYCPNGYRIFSTRELAALHIVEQKGVLAAAAYFSQTSKMTYIQTLKHLEHLYINLNPYRIQKQQYITSQ